MNEICICGPLTFFSLFVWTWKIIKLIRITQVYMTNLIVSCSGVLLLRNVKKNCFNILTSISFYYEHNILSNKIIQNVSLCFLRKNSNFIWLMKLQIQNKLENCMFFRKRLFWDCIIYAKIQNFYKCYCCTKCSETCLRWTSFIVPTCLFGIYRYSCYTAQTNKDFLHWNFI